MNEPETRMILSQASGIDNRKITDAAIIMWHAAFTGFTYEEVKWALLEHVKTSTEYLAPAHLIEIIHTKRAEYRMMNPGISQHPDSWLEWERMQELAAVEARAVRATGKPYAVEVMDNLEIES